MPPGLGAPPMGMGGRPPFPPGPPPNMGMGMNIKYEYCYVLLFPDTYQTNTNNIGRKKILLKYINYVKKITVRHIF